MTHPNAAGPSPKPEPSTHEPRKPAPPEPASRPGWHNDGKEYGTAKRPAGGAHADPKGHRGPG